MTKKSNKKQSASYKQNPWILLAMGLVFAGIAYGLASWAIYSGAIPIYLAAFASIYMTLRYTVLGVLKFIRN